MSSLPDADPSTFSPTNSHRTTDSTLVPTIAHDASPGDPMWFVEHVDGGHDVKLVRMTNVLSATPTFTDFVTDVDDYNVPVPAPQPGGGTFPTNDARILSAALRGNRLVATHAVGLDFNNNNTDGVRGDGIDETSVRWYEFDVSTATPTVKQQGNVDPAFGVSTYFPSIEIAPNGDI